MILSPALSQQKRQSCLKFQLLPFPFKSRCFRKRIYFYTWPCRLNTFKLGLFTQTLTRNKNSHSLSLERHKAVPSLLSKPPVTTYSYKSPLQAYSHTLESQSPPTTLCSLLPISQIFKLGTYITWTIITAQKCSFLWLLQALFHSSAGLISSTNSFRILLPKLF